MKGLKGLETWRGTGARLYGGGTRAEYENMTDQSLSQKGFETMLHTKLCIHVYVGCLMKV